MFQCFVHSPTTGNPIVIINLQQLMSNPQVLPAVPTYSWRQLQEYLELLTPSKYNKVIPLKTLQESTNEYVSHTAATLDTVKLANAEHQ